MEWAWICTRLRLAEWHLDGALTASAEEVMRAQLRRAKQAYRLAMTALEHANLDSEQERELRERLQVLSIRLFTLERQRLAARVRKDSAGDAE